MEKTEKTPKRGDQRLTSEAREAFKSALMCGNVDDAVRMIAQFLAVSPYEEYRVTGYDPVTGDAVDHAWVHHAVRLWDGLEGPFYSFEREGDVDWPLLRALNVRLREDQLMVISVGEDSYVFEHVASNGRVPPYLRLRKSV